MKRTLKDRIWKRGIAPERIRFANENHVARMLAGTRFLDLSEHRAYVLRNPPVRKGYALRIAIFDADRVRESRAKWKAAGGYLP